MLFKKVSIFFVLISFLIDIRMSVVERGKLIWSDEFDYIGKPNPFKWTNWGDMSLGLSNSFTDTNAYADGSSLVMELRKESFNGKNYTGSNIVTKRGFLYGILEMRARLGKGAGTWSNFWLFPDYRKSSSWPGDGEIDVAETIQGGQKTEAHVNLHVEKNSTRFKTGKAWTFLYNDTAYHVWTLVWTPQILTIYVDDRLHFVYKNEGTGIQNGWPFDASMNVVLNFKLGLPGDSWSGRYGIDDSIFPARHYVDYVRYYELPASSLTNQNVIRWEKLVRGGTPLNLTFMGFTWAPGCEFRGNYFRNETTRALVTNQCIYKCSVNPECTHFTWSIKPPYTEGLCMMHKGAVTLNDAFVSSDSNTACAIYTRL